MLTDFLIESTIPDPKGKTRLPRLFTAFKRHNATAGCGWRKVRFLNELLRSGVDVRQENGTLYVHGLTLQADFRNARTNPRAVVSRERVDTVKRCARCGGPCESAYYTGPGSRCENCEAGDLAHKIYGRLPRYRYTGLPIRTP